MEKHNATTNQTSSPVAARMRNLLVDAFWNPLEAVLFLQHVFLGANTTTMNLTAQTTATNLFLTTWNVVAAIFRCTDLTQKWIAVT